MEYTGVFSLYDAPGRLRDLRDSSGTSAMGRRQVAGNEAFCTVSGAMGPEAELERDSGIILYDVGYGVSFGEANRGIWDQASAAGWGHRHRG